MTAPDAVDESWSRLSPADCRARGIRLVYGYLSHDPSKNLTAADVRAYHAAGVGVWLGWESDAGRPLLGAAAGRQDALDAAGQLAALYAAVGYAPRNRIAVPFSCDTNATAGQFPTVLAYYVAADGAIGSRFDVGAYGHAALIDLLAAHGFNRGLFQTYAWSAGRLSTHTDLYQYENGQTVAGASVDFDRIISGPAIGAWWPPGHPFDTAAMSPAVATAQTHTTGDPMIVISAPNRGVAEKVPGGKYHLAAGEWAAVKAIAAKSPAAVVMDAISTAAWDALVEKRGKL